MAAHLHDSVLQTFAMIQRTDDPRKMATLAAPRNGSCVPGSYGTGGIPSTVRDAVRRPRRDGDRVEQASDVPVEVVRSSVDLAMGPRLKVVAASARR